ncbi:uncharacterized protein Tco025E_05193 [Trypanosoma conorhini]|uniref:Uncharacterized protein n=1 Tax=Trypanosoma conorhini TaxID=83891 RepID=A0A3R7L594_9TRYP|nr:uncharacterized protein Tco025E_05193 [Trypanosoma conorhini]RNF16427.1 hypothetical protein Tco025E_05193 [Trypanosoma conorhini]
MEAKVAECNWFLLFDIALSHGESLRQQRLRYCGLLTLLRSAGLLGPKTGVFQVLLESLWLLHGKPLRSSEEGATTKRDIPIPDLTVDFDGFLAIMNVVCVRCYQTQRCAELLEEAVPLLDAVRLSAEDQVQLKESVVYTGRRFFKPLISRCIVLKKSVVSLNSMKNDWTPYTNQFVVHVMAASAPTIVFPLFERYAEAGRIYRAAFEKMVDDVFPNFTSLQRKSAVSVFDYRGFFGIHNLMQYSALEFPNGRVAALELDSFAEALLMLGIVAYSDEVQYEHHRPLTAKVWSVFEDYYGKFLGAPMVTDPILENKYASILPAISLLFPSRVPIDTTSSFILGGWNLTVDDREEVAPARTHDCPPRMLQANKLRRRSNGGNERRSSGPVPSSTAGMASKLFVEEINRKIQAEYDLPIYGMRRSAVYLNQERAMAFQRGANRVEVVIPPFLWDLASYTKQVRFTEEKEKGTLTLSPVARAVVSLRDGSGSTIFSSKEVLFVAASLVEVIPAAHVRELKNVFARHSTDAVMTFEQFDSACVELCVEALVLQWGDSAAFLKTYLERRDLDKPSVAASDSCKPDTIAFEEFVAAVATLLLHQLGADGGKPNIPYLLGVVLSRVAHKFPPLSGSKTAAGASLKPNPPQKFTQPYNARIDVPYANALRQKALSLDFFSDVEEILKDVGKDRASVRLLPDFPAEARTVAVVSQYSDEKGASEKVNTDSASLRGAFLKKEMVVCPQGLKAE